MKQIVSLVAVLVVVSTPAFAASKKKTKVKTTTTTTQTTTTTTTAAADTSGHGYASSAAPQHDGFLLSVDAGLGTAIEKFHFGVGFHAEAPVYIDHQRFRFGAQTGFYFGPSSPTTWIIPVMATGTYEFNTAGTLKPYVGIGIGISIAHVSSDFGSDTSTDFAFQVNPGVGFGEGSKYYFELPLGTMAKNFFVLPSVGMHF